MIRHTQQIGGVTVNFSVGRLDDMPRCATCGRALCGCTDAQFKIPAPRTPTPADGNGSEALCQFFPDQAAPVLQLFSVTADTPTVDDRIERIERELAAIRREAA